MTKKLTLSLDEAVIEAAKKYAGKQGVSLSSLVENFLKNRTGVLSTKRKTKVKAESETPLMDEIREIQKHMRTPKEVKAYEKELFARKPEMKEWFDIMDKKHG